MVFTHDWSFINDQYKLNFNDELINIDTNIYIYFNTQLARCTYVGWILISRQFDCCFHNLRCTWMSLKHLHTCNNKIGDALFRELVN